MTPAAPVLRLDGVHKSFSGAGGAVSVLHGVDLCVERGEFLMITGPSGSGKTTLLNLAALLDRPTGGQVWFDGQAVSGLAESALCALRKRRVGVVFQRFCLLPRRTALENVLFRFRYLDGASSEARAAAGQALEQVGLREAMDRPARVLSAGEMQRVAIARAVAVPPDLLVADEPTGNLDAAATDRVMACFRELNRSGITILLVTHNERLLPYASRHLQCRNGALTS